MIGATSLGYLSLEGVVRAIGMHKDKFCRACFDGKYPIPVPPDVRMQQTDAGRTVRHVAPEGGPDDGSPDSRLISMNPFPVAVSVQWDRDMHNARPGSTERNAMVEIAMQRNLRPGRSRC